jgi:hypothetical protein
VRQSEVEKVVEAPTSRTEPRWARTERTASVPLGYKSPKPTDVLALQRAAGNRAVVALIDVQRKGSTPVKPKHPNSKQKSLKGKLEKAVKKSDAKLVKSIQADMWARNPAYLADLMAYKVTKHKGEKAKQDAYSLEAPPASGLPTFRSAWRMRSTEAVAYFATSAWKIHAGACQTIALEDPKFFIEHFVLDGLRRDNPGKLVVQELVEEKQFLSVLAAAAPAAYQGMADQIPVLKLLTGVEKSVEADLQRGATVSIADVVDRLFDAFVNNRGIEVAYSGSAMDTNDVILTGQTAADKNLRTEKKKIVPDLPDTMSTACHQLLALFQRVLAGYPGLESLDVKPGDEQTAVLTQPLAGLAGGLIKSSYGGNVFDSDCTPTGQIFFSGNRAKPSKSHSWLIVENIAYDPVLGTKGAAVPAAIQRRFEFNDGSAVAQEEGGTGVLTKAPDLNIGTEYGITTAWRLT